MAVYDCFMFFNEFDLLEVRLAEHDPFVDFFVLAQADRTHTGKKKKLLFNKEDPRFKKYAHKIIVVHAELEENPKSAWDNEAAQRQAAIDAIDLEPNDIVFMADVDEIISRDKWGYLLKRMENELILGVWLRMFYYAINLELMDHPWAMPKLIKGKLLKETPFKGNTLRCSPAAVITPFPCGWHFSYLLSVEGIIEKISSLAHQENNLAKNKNPKKIQEAILQKKDLFGRGLKFRAVKIDNSWPMSMVQSEQWSVFTCSVSPIELLQKRVEESTSKLRQTISPIIRKLVKKLRRNAAKPESSGFDSQKFELLMSARPNGFDPKEWRRLIEFLGFALLEIKPAPNVNECVKTFLLALNHPHCEIPFLLKGEENLGQAVFASRACAVTHSKLVWSGGWKSEAQRQQSKQSLYRLGCDNFLLEEQDAKSLVATTSRIAPSIAVNETTL